MAAHADRYNCDRCTLGRHCDEDFSWPGSRGPERFAFLAIRGVIESRTCFLPMLSPLSRELLRLHAEREHGILPVAGGALDQSAVYSRAMSVIDSTLADLRREESKRPHG